MRTAIVILTLNAEKYGIWDQVLQAAAQQDISDCARFILDSFSGDDTCTKAKMLGWQIFKIKREKFNHGNTRNRICRILHKKGFAQVIFLTQDAILTQTNSCSLLVDFLKRNELSGCYGRQISWQKNTFDCWQRERCYSDSSYIKTADDLTQEGIMAAFFSNAFAVWSLEKVIRAGGFPHTDFGEDALLAFNILKKGGKIGYCSEAVVRHEHSNKKRDLFLRGIQVGKFHGKHPEFRRAASVIRQKKKKNGMPLSFLFSFAVKFAGYCAGRLITCRLIRGR